ncbi:MAG: hypothetical protein ACXWC7_09140 [Chitinophagaceae bacterium]
MKHAGKNFSDPSLGMSKGSFILLSGFYLVGGSLTKNNNLND